MLWQGDWVEQVAKMNQVVVENIFLDKSGGRKRPVRHFTRNEFWKCMVCILLAVIYGIKEHHIWRGNEPSVSKKGQTPLTIDVHVNTYLIMVRCYLYHPHSCYACHWAV